MGIIARAWLHIAGAIAIALLLSSPVSAARTTDVATAVVTIAQINDDMSQAPRGTGFHIGGGNIVTASHVCTAIIMQAGAVIYAIPPNQGLPQRLRMIKVDPRRDLCLLYSPYLRAMPEVIFNMGPLEKDQQLTAYAYPKGASVRKLTGKYLRPDKDATLFEYDRSFCACANGKYLGNMQCDVHTPSVRTSILTVGGYSGGPIADSEGYVRGLSSASEWSTAPDGQRIPQEGIIIPSWELAAFFNDSRNVVCSKADVVK